MAFSEEARMKGLETRRQNAEKRAAEKLMSAGVGESRVFRNPDASDPYAHLRTCHVGGKLVGDLPENVIALLSFDHTDEGIAARNAGKSDTRVSVGDPLHKQLQHKKDDVLDRGMEAWEASDPMKELLDKYKRPGFRNRFLGDLTVKNRGMRGWKPVIGENGDPVKLGNLFMSEMPEEKAKQRNKHYQELGNRRLEQVQKEYVESGGQTAVADQ